MGSLKDPLNELEAALHNATVMADGGPGYVRHHGWELPDKYMPGRYFNSRSDSQREALIKAIAHKSPAPWFIKRLVNHYSWLKR